MTPFVHSPAALLAAGLLAFPLVLGAQQAERFELTGDRIAIFNLAGSATVEAGSGSAVVVEVRRGGADAGRLEIAHGPLRGAETLRIRYPDDEIVYRGRDRWSGSTDVRVHDDGTFGWSDESGGSQVRVRSAGSGLDAYADLRILVPRGTRVELYLAVGEMSASGVDGRLRLDGSSTKVTTSRTSGDLVVDVGSGSVDVNGHTGGVSIDTGSGSVGMSTVRGDALSVDTGSGQVDVTDAAVSQFHIDTGSGRVRATGLAADVIDVDTGSGSVGLTCTRVPHDITVDTGSGSVDIQVPDGLNAAVDLETSSGDVTVDFPVQTRRWERGELHGVIGTGGGHIKIDSGSGDIAIRKT
jgi:lia operon protein LiaG